MPKPRVSFGSIYRRGKKGTFYFENRKRGVKPTSLGTSDPQEAAERAATDFGVLQYQSQEKRAEKLLEQIDATRRKAAMAPRTRICLTDVEPEYIHALNRAGVRKSKLHTDATSEVPLSPSTLKSYRRYVRQFRAWLAEKAPLVRYMDEVTPQLADAYFESFRDTHSAKGYNNRLSGLRVIWGLLTLKAGVANNPFTPINSIPLSTVAKEQKHRQAFTEAQLQHIFEKAKGTKWEPACYLAYETGLRAGDVFSLRVDQVDLKDGFVGLRGQGTRKAGKEQVFPIPHTLPCLRTWIQNLPTDSVFVFPDLARSFTGERDPDAADAKFILFLKHSCNIDTMVTDKDGKRYDAYGFHSFRASHATFKRSAGASIEQVQEDLGHDDEKTTRGYIQEGDDPVKLRALADYTRLPLAGGSVADGIIHEVKKAYARLAEPERQKLRAGLRSIVGEEPQGK